MKSNEKSGGELIEEPSEEPNEEAGRELIEEPNEEPNEKTGGELIEEPSEESNEEADKKHNWGKKGEFEYESINCLLSSE